MIALRRLMGGCLKNHTLPHRFRNAALCITAKLTLEWQRWVILGTFGRGDATIHVCYVFISDQGGAWQRNVATCH
jgi:hypothetical protein